MRRPAPGRYVAVTTAGGPFQAFVPMPLPPEPPVVWSAALRRRFDAALVALGRLDAVTALLPNAALLLYCCRSLKTDQQDEVLLAED